MRLVEKSGLNCRIFWIAKVAQTNAYKAKSLFWIQGHTLPQGHGDVRELLAGRRRRTWCVAASESLELAGLQFEDYSACDPQFLARCGPSLLREATDHWLDLGQRHIVLKRVLGRHGLCRPVRNDFALVDSPGQLEQAYAIATKAALKH